MPLPTPALSPHVAQDSSISEASLQLEKPGKGLPTLPAFPGSRASGGEGKTNTDPQTEQKRVNSKHCLYLPLRLRHTAQFLGACQAGLLSGTVCLWGDGCLEWEGERDWSGGREPDPAPDQAARLGSKGHGVEPPGKGHWNQQPAHPRLQGQMFPPLQKPLGTDAFPPPRAPQDPDVFSGLPP